MARSKVEKHAFGTIYILAIILYVFGYVRIFTDQVKNKTLIYFSFITFLWGITSHYRYHYTKLSGTEIMKINVPDFIKCFFGENRCNEGDINIWTLMHFIIYLIAGIFFPNRYIFFFIISLLCELFELTIVAYNAKWVIDPLFNMLGYLVGNIFHNKLHNF